MSGSENGIRGLALIDPSGKLAFHSGAASDPRVRAMLSDAGWLKEAEARKLGIIRLVDANHIVLVVSSQKTRIAIMLGEAGETSLQFFLNVEFANDIIEHLLTDPFDAMAVIDAKERLVFVSPIHEKFFGLKAGEGVGKKVRDVIENTRLHHVVRTGVAEVGQIQKMNGRERVVSRHPIRHNGDVVGAIGRVMFKGPQQVEALSRRVNTLEREIETYRNEAKEHSRGESALEAIIGQSPAVLKLRDLIRKVAPLDIPVLIQGESGTGKELVAKALHIMSSRRDNRLVTVNAAALPAQLVESELFGYEPGSFTGADQKGRLGKFEQADKGTIFLDEIGDMPIEVQSKLLRVLQDRVVERVGGDKPRKVDFRLCSATNRNLEESVEQGQFRLDLYYRISPFVIPMPTLAERLEDIPLLVSSFVNELAAQYGKDVPEVDSDVFDYLTERPWPGNVRELRHVVERAFVFSEHGRLRLSNFSDAAGQRKPEPAKAEVVINDASGGTLRTALDRYEHDLMTEAMARFNGNKKKVAEHLGISRSYLYKKLGE
ncbi:AAA domain family protein [Ochrobactrum quorumnocens]|uniref:AAA domain family protein n=1 Tax=Ochrobactrum quorumnocens TaxID=271865 RepID=A0A248UEA0_9HYPH|nr:sigma 54-interacting transcriptional regulator [[Ochrobactrum] quorumnocens]ASV84860.1 AAA domain family protein [[Ochrobactrum] quorumnocens]